MFVPHDFEQNFFNIYKMMVIIIIIFKLKTKNN